MFMLQMDASRRRDLLTIVCSLMGVTVLAWMYLFSVAGDMSGAGMLGVPAWDGSYFVMMFLMWSIMMVGMMLPSIVPTVLVYSAVARNTRKQGRIAAPTMVFVLGYIVLWILFSVAATGAQWGLSELALLSPSMMSNSSWLTASLLIAAGLYQWLPIKNQCLSHCQSPIQFISTHWAAGTTGALKMGIQHGVFCLGCCWVLMLLLFVGGVMNLIWITMLAIFILLEKVLPFGAATGRWLGVILILGGVLAAVVGF